MISPVTFTSVPFRQHVRGRSSQVTVTTRGGLFTTIFNPTYLPYLFIYYFACFLVYGTDMRIRFISGIGSLIFNYTGKTMLLEIKW